MSESFEVVSRGGWFLRRRIHQYLLAGTILFLSPFPPLTAAAASLSRPRLPLVALGRFGLLSGDADDASAGHADERNRPPHPLQPEGIRAHDLMPFLAFATRLNLGRKKAGCRLRL